MKEKNEYPSYLIKNIGTAKKLKKIGFDIPCNFFLPLKMYGDFDTKELDFDFKAENHNDSYDYLSIPTYIEVFEWFREKGFECFIEIDNQSMFGEGCYYCYVITNQRGRTIDWKGGFNNYSEAREALVIELIQTYQREQYKIK